MYINVKYSLCYVYINVYRVLIGEYVAVALAGGSPTRLRDDILNVSGEGWPSRVDVVPCVKSCPLRADSVKYRPSGATI